MKGVNVDTKVDGVNEGARVTYSVREEEDVVKSSESKDSCTM